MHRHEHGINDFDGWRSILRKINNRVSQSENEFAIDFLGVTAKTVASHDADSVWSCDSREVKGEGGGVTIAFDETFSWFADGFVETKGDSADDVGSLH